MACSAMDSCYGNVLTSLYAYRSRSWANENSFNPIALQRLCTYEVRLEDVGYCLRCECLAVDVFGRSGEPALGVSSPVQPGIASLIRFSLVHPVLLEIQKKFFESLLAVSCRQDFPKLKSWRSMVKGSTRVSMLSEGCILVGRKVKVKHSGFVPWLAVPT